ncbi:replication initiation protein, partial [Thiolapillus sp.]|uniref:replication initiation protein n=1 Tax=Thiolapillus sp. TaxID=2017437 RepID=UPI003AF62131
MSGDIDYLLGNSVTMSNVIARASQDLLLSEKRIVALAQSLFDSRRPVTDFSSSSSRTVVVSVSDYSELSNSVSNKSVYRILLSASKSLFDRYIEFHRPSFSGVRRVRFRWLESITYVDDSGSVELCFSRRVLPLLVGLTERFTTYKLEDIVSFRSIYSLRLYEFLLSYVDSSSDFSHFVIDFAALRFALQVPDSYRFNNFRSRVLDSGIDDICLAVPWTIDYKLIKTGRRVTALDFSVRR